MHFSLSHAHAICPVHLIFFDLVVLIMFGKGKGKGKVVPVLN
jgi:hypothetical protein